MRLSRYLLQKYFVAWAYLLATNMPFIHAENDYICYTIEGELAKPMRGSCTQLTEKVVQSGHWMAQEKPEQLNAFLLEWLENL